MRMARDWKATHIVQDSILSILHVVTSRDLLHCAAVASTLQGKATITTLCILGHAPCALLLQR